MPEPRGRTFAELDLLFERHVPARKFAKTEVDVFEESVVDSHDRLFTQYREDITVPAEEDTGMRHRESGKAFQ